MAADVPFSLFKELDRYTDDDLPPVMDWRPEECHDIDMRIDRSGSWFHEGTQIDNQRMVRLASILRIEGPSYYLVTPEIKFRIEVEDVPFVAVVMDVVGEGPKQSLQFTTNIGDQVTLDSSHPLRLEVYSNGDEPVPYITVRNDLEAVLPRDLYYQLADLFVTDASSTMLGVWSEGTFTTLCKATAVF
ncbi:MAG: proteophosphoglycan precursor [Acidiferrobacteraceae bacterium]|jgi:hypothetical protein|nr:proteophosphoglycan precursor [Acidiferrobacteraceae bacterium]|tara:strand:+ start:2982 stop:3545 length:564 start_codon:yes stop_codon:yes gene_type:complete